MCSGSDLFLCLLAVFFPPVAVWIKRGICTADSLINIALCVLGYLPGLLHSWYIVYLYPEPEYSAIPQDQEGNYRVYYFSTSGGPEPRNEQRPTYGTLSTPGGGQFPQQQNGTTNYSSPGPKNSGSTQPPQPRQDGPSEQGDASEPAPPPTYAQVVQADNKIQSQD